MKIQRSGIQLKKLAGLIKDIEYLTGVRNRAAHGEKISREDANLVYGAWFRGSALKVLFEAIHPSR